MAIFAISALGAGFFAGLKATSPAMKATADHYYETQHLADYRLLSTMGFTDDDVEALRAQPQLGQIMPGYALDVLVHNPEGDEVAHLSALPEDTGEDSAGWLNRPVLKEGRLPQAGSECLADSQTSYAIGDEVVLSQQNDADTMDLLAATRFTVVGIADSPSYVSFQRGNTNIGNGRVTFFLYVTEEAFDSEWFLEIFATAADGKGLSSFSPEYQAVIDTGAARLEEFGEERAQIRYDEIVQEANEQLADARRELDEAKADADEQLAEAAGEIADAEAEIADGWAEYDENQKKLADAEIELADGERALADALVLLLQGQQEYEAGEALYAEGYARWQAAVQQLDGLKAALAQLEGMAAAMQGMLEPGGDAAAFAPTAQGAAALLRQLAAQLQDAGQDAAQLTAAADGIDAALSAGAPGYPAALGTLAAANAGLQGTVAATQAALDETAQTLAANRARLDDANNQLVWNWAEYGRSAQRLEEAREELEDGRRQLAEAYETLTDAEAELADGKAEYEEKKAEAEEKIADAETELADAQRELDDLDEPEWLVHTRDDNPGYSGFASDTDRIDAIAVVIPVFFFLVAALVCLTTMTRMVEEQRGTIGTLKALGYSRAAIATKYVLYAAVASTTGAALGVVGGYALFPPAIWDAYSIMYIMPAIRLGDSMLLAIGSVAACVLCTTVATLAACLGELRSVPAQLMRPKAPRAGKRVLLEHVGFIWKRLSFMVKVTARNLFRYKKRFFMTVIGVAGCTALLVTGFGLRDSITGIVPRQYGDISRYDLVVALNESSSAEAATGLNELLPELGEALYVKETLVDAKSGSANNSGMTTYVEVMERPELFTKFITLRERKSQQDIAFPPGGDGVVITEKLADRLRVGEGDRIEVNRAGETPVTVTVTGVAENYIYNYIFMTPAQYRQLFGEAPEYDTVLLRMNDEAKQDVDAVLQRVLEEDPVAGAVDIAALQDQFNDMFAGLNSVVWLIIAAAALLAFVVLYNLTNINITERSREIATLKVLGFYNGEVASYVFRENIVLTLIGSLVGLGLGVFLHDFVITTAEIDEVMFRRVVELLSYVWSVLFTLLCGVVVNFVMMGRLRRIDMVESLKSNE